MRQLAAAALAPELWDALTDTCRREHICMGELLSRSETRGHTDGRISAIRVFIVQYFRKGAALPADPGPQA